MESRNGHSANGQGGIHANGNGKPSSLLLGWEQLARATARPLRISVLEILGMDGGRTLSPSDLSQELQIPLSNTNYHVTELADEFADRLRDELDFRVEAANAVEIAANVAHLAGVHIPVVHEELSTSRVLVMEWLDGVSVRDVDAIDAMGFDRVVLATHSDQALAMLADPTASEHAILGAIPYQANEAVLHTDRRQLPRRRRAWASWNFHLAAKPVGRSTVTYWMNKLQNLDRSHPLFVTLNPTRPIAEGQMIQSFSYTHPLFDHKGIAAQRELWRDGWGVALLILAPLSALGLYLREAGLAGSFLDLLFRGLFGVFGLLAPPALAAAGIMLLRPARPRNVRVVAGWLITGFALAGPWHHRKVSIGGMLWPPRPSGI